MRLAIVGFLVAVKWPDTQSVVPGIDASAWLVFNTQARCTQTDAEQVPVEAASQMGFNLHTCRLLLEPLLAHIFAQLRIGNGLAWPGVVNALAKALIYLLRATDRGREGGEENVSYRNYKSV